MAANLIQEVGRSWAWDRLAGCMFFDAEGKPRYISTMEDWPQRKVATRLVDGTPEEPSVVADSISESFFKSLAAFKTPPLGWRMAGEGRYLAFISRNNTVQVNRAISPATLLIWESPATLWLAHSGNLSLNTYRGANALTLLVMKPHYERFREGINKMREGQLFSFAMSPNFAVIPDVDETEALYCNQNKAATIDRDFNIKWLLPSVRPLFESNL